MRLTARREAILRSLVSKPYLTSTDFYALDPRQTDRGRRRALADFTKLGYLNRRRLARDGAPSDHPLTWQYVYWLSERGLALARRTGLDPQRRGSANDEKSSFMLRHDHAVTSFHLSLERALGAEVWWRQTGLRHTVRAGGEVITVNPDALFYLGGFYYFLEVERSKQGEYRDGESGLLRKARHYLAYADPRLKPFKERWPEMEGFFVLFVLASQVRAANFLRVLTARLPRRLFLVADRPSAEEDVLGPILRRPSDLDELRSLIGGADLRSAIRQPTSNVRKLRSRGP